MGAHHSTGKASGKSQAHGGRRTTAVTGTMTANAVRVRACTRCDPRSYTAHCASVSQRDARRVRGEEHVVQAHRAVRAVAAPWHSGPPLAVYQVPRV